MSLVVENIVKSYGDYKAVNNLSFVFDKPGVFALLGTNGAGKSTAIRAILGMLSIDSGKITWNDKNVIDSHERIGYLAEERGLYPKYKIMDQLIYFSELKGLKKEDAKKSIDYWFQRLKVDEYKVKRAEQLSKGNQQKIQLIAALIADPKLLILDEPLSGLDPVNAELFKSVIREQIERKKYIIMSSHQMPIVEEFCENIVIMNKGQTIIQGNLNAIKKSYGRVMLNIKCEGDITALVQEQGLNCTNRGPNGMEFKVDSEQQAMNLLNSIIQNNIPLIKYELREPSLNEIFIEKVGESNEN
ncbi:MAG: ATP-binding cassette domain-containing protein [Clostridiales bacterium]|nr:ATP-binding cassette domain-containing protein [Clostridiales bacterium]